MRRAWAPLLMAAAWLTLAPAPAAKAADAAPLQAPRVAVLAADMGPMARIDLTWPNDFRVTAEHGRQHLALTFDQPFNAPDLGALRQRLGGWIKGIDKTGDRLVLTAAQPAYFTVEALGRTLSVEMVWAPDRPVTAARAVAPKLAQRPVLTQPAPRKAAPVPAPRPKETVHEDAAAKAAAKRLRRGTPAVASGTVQSDVTLIAQQIAPPQLRAEVGEDVAVLNLDWAQLVTVAANQEGSELFLRVNRPVDPRMIEGLAEQMPEWLESASAGYDSLLFVARPEVRVLFDHAGRQSTIRLSLANADAPSPAAGGAQDETDVRLSLLKARLAARQGETSDARQKLDSLQAANPDNADVLMEKARIEESVGSFRRATRLYEEALEVNPNRRDAAAAQRRIRRDHGPQIRIDTDYQKVHGGDDQVFTVISGRFWPTETLDAGFKVENRYLRDRQVQRVNGAIQGVTTNKQRGEFYIGGSPASGHRIEGALLGSVTTPGAALRYTFRTPDTLTRLTGTFREGYFDLVEGIADDATRDRVGLRHEHQFDEDWYGEIEVGASRFAIDNISTAATGIDVTGAISYRVPWDGADLYVGYSLNAFYTGALETRTNVNGNTFNPLPLTDTEIHSITANVGGVFGDDWRYNVFGSLGYDRFGGGFGPGIGCEVVHEVYDDMEYGMRCSHFRVTGRGDGSAVSRLGGYFLVRF